MVPSVDPVTALADLADRVDGLKEITPRVCELAEQLIGSTRAAISVWDDERKVLKVLSGAFGVTGPELSSMVSDGTNLRSNAASVYATREPYVSNAAVGDRRILQRYVERYELERVLSVPLRLAERCIGVLHLVNKPTDFTSEDLARAEGLASWVATAVELGRSILRLRVQRRLDGILTSAAVAVASGERMEDSLLPAFASIADVMCGTVVAYVPRSGPPLVWRAATRNARLESRFLADALLCTPESIWACSRGPDDTGWAARHTPVMLYGERVASLSVLRERGVPMAPDEADALARLANLAALARATHNEQRQRAELALLHERQRIAEGLHERVAQILFAAQVGLDSVLERGGEDAERIREVRALLTKGDSAIRDVIHQLSPVPETGIAQRLRALASDVEEEFAVPIELTVDPVVEERLTDAFRSVRECLLKVAREAVVNAAKHARPCRVEVALGLDYLGNVVLSVLDDGPGLSADGVTGSSYGIPSMHRAVAEVGGTLELGPGPDHAGTMVRALVGSR